MRAFAALGLCLSVALVGCSSGRSNEGTTAVPPAPVQSNEQIGETSQSTTAEVATEPTTEPSASAAPVATIDAPTWKPCQETTLATLQCATVKVPIDHAKPDGPTLDLALSVAKAKGTKRGTMLINPGGPGASGVEYTLSVANRMPAEVKDAFDIVGFDPRGTGKSMPVDCVDDAFLDQANSVDPTPDTPEERAALQAADLENQCRAKYSDIDAYSTVRVAQDMDALRAALGDDLLTYYGVSYGSYLGATYATLFPGKVGAMVLDGAFLPESTGDQSALVQWGGFNKAFTNWSAWCAKEPNCAFTAPDVQQRYSSLIDQMEAKPLKVGTRTAGEGAVLNATIASLYSKSSWPIFAAALAQAEGGDASGLVALGDSYTQRDPKDGSYTPLIEANNVINCATGITQPVTGGQQFVENMKALGPLARFVDDTVDTTNCNATQLPITYTGTKPIVVIGGENDPATPYSQALSLTKALGSKASLITFTGEGHGGLFESACAKDAVSAYYLKGTPPGAIKCAAADPATKPEWLAALKAPNNFQEIPTDEGAAFLGLDASLFASRTFRVASSGDDATEALLGLLKTAGFKPLTNTDIPEIPESRLGASQQGTDFAIWSSFGPQAFATKDLTPLSPLARSTKPEDGRPVGTIGSLVVIAVPINAEALRQLG
jgi:pimeloyl-ACP methyl ester carboxylesterase